MRRILLLTTIPMLLLAASASSAWRMEIESKTVYAGQTGVTLAFTYAWDIKLQVAVLPVIVRSIDAGSFWTGSLPYDTTNLDGDRFTNRVAWHSSVQSWASIILELRPGHLPFSPGAMCNTEADTNHYNAASPDHFVVSNQGSGNLAAQPGGITWVTITFDVTEQTGQFEFDTACLSAALNKIYMIDGSTYVDHGPPPGTNDVDFNKGIVTIAPRPDCMCAQHCDLNLDQRMDPVDMVLLVNYIFRGLDQRAQIPGCIAGHDPNRNGEWNCDGQINPLDVVYCIFHVYHGLPEWAPCDPCECTAYPTGCPHYPW